MIICNTSELASRKETAWRRFEKAQLCAERYDLIEKGFITPASHMRPQLMVKNEDGSWSPDIKRV